MTRTRRGFGKVAQMRSGRWQASYIGPDNQRHLAPDTFGTKAPAESWLADRRREIEGGTWGQVIAAAAPLVLVTLDDYFGPWLADRTTDRKLKPRTVALYKSLYRRLIKETLGPIPITAILAPTVRSWYTQLGTQSPTQRAHAYGLLRTVLGTANEDGQLPAGNPCRIRGGGSTKAVHDVEPANLAEVKAIVTAIPERYRAMVLLGCWGALRFGEVTELRRKNIDLKNGVIKVRQGVTRVPGEDGEPMTIVVGDTKSEAGARDIAIPPHLIPILRDHLAEHVQFGRDALLFPAAGDPNMHLAPSTFNRVYYPARAKAGRPDLRFHDLRHTGLTMAAQTGATLAELMGRAGHSTPSAALRYQHAARGRDAEIAAALSKMAEAE